MTKEQFKKFAKEEFGYEISFEKSDEPDTFKSLFGELSKNIKVGDEVADDFHKENVVSIDNCVIRKSKLVTKVLEEMKGE